MRPGGRGVFAMPAATFQFLTDADLVHILAYVRSVPAVDGLSRASRWGRSGASASSLGKFKTQPQIISGWRPLPAAADSLAERGRYLVQTTCTECHGAQLRGDGFMPTPDLRIVKGFSPEQFTTLMRTGVAPGNPKLPTCRRWRRSSSRNFTDPEIAAVYAYLHGLGS